MGTPLGSGRVLAGRYRLLSALGSGGMGTVWLGQDELLDRQVAVKEVSPPAGVTASERDILHQRTLREARTAARLAHPNVVTIYDVVDDGGRPWIVMQLIPARSLRTIVAEDGPLTPPQAAKVALQVLAALGAAHALGIMHRDVKPGNVLIDADGRAVLADFGIARANDSPTLTASGMLVGSPSYIAPERARGERGGPASDLWSLGATIYAAVEGRPPYDRPGAFATLTAVVTEDPDPPRRLGPLWPVISGLLSREPADRLRPIEAERMFRRIAERQPAARTEPLPTLAEWADPGGARGDQPHPADRLGSAQRTLAFHPQVTAPPTAPDAAVDTPAAAADTGVDTPALAADTAVDTPAPAADTPAPAADTAVDTPAPAAIFALAPAEPVAGPEPVAGHESVLEPAPEPVPEPVPVPEAESEPVAEHEPAHEPEAALAVAEPVLDLAERVPVPAATVPAATVPAEAAPAGAAPVPVFPGAPAAAPRPWDWRAWPRRQLTWVIAAVVALVVAAGVLVALKTVGHSAARPPASARTPAAAASGPHSSAAATPQATPGSATGTQAAVPAGYHLYRDPTGFSIAVPNGWEVSHQGHYVYIQPSSGGMFLLIDQSDQPKPDPLADWQQQEASRKGTYPGYHRIRLQAISYPQAEKAADWEFTYDRNGVPTHVLNRNILANATHAYALYWSTPGSEWDQAFRIFEVFARTFQPAK